VSVLVIVSCGRKKIWDRHPTMGPVQAKDAYIGPPFKINKRYAEKFADRWIILSAKYGFIDPDFVIPENYNVTFKDPRTNPISVGKLIEQIREKGLDKFDKIIILGGKDYANIVRKAFEKFNVKIIAPTLGLRLGEAMSKVKKAVKNNSPFDC